MGKATGAAETGTGAELLLVEVVAMLGSSMEVVEAEEESTVPFTTSPLSWCASTMLSKPSPLTTSTSVAMMGKSSDEVSAGDDEFN